MSSATVPSVRPVGEVLREIPLPPYVTGEDVQFAVRAVVVHAPRRWSGGTICRNDANPHPCRLHRWGRRVLALRGLPPAVIDALIEGGDPTVPVPAVPLTPGAVDPAGVALALPGGIAHSSGVGPVGA